MNLFLLQLHQLLLAKFVIGEIGGRGQRVNPRQLYELIDSVFPQEAFERAEPHGGSLHMAQMVLHEVGNSLPCRTAPLETLQNLCRDLRALFRMTIIREALAVAANTNRFSDIVKKAAVGQSFTRRLKMA